MSKIRPFCQELSDNVADSDSQKIGGLARQKVVIILIIPFMTSKEIRVE